MISNKMNITPLIAIIEEIEDKTWIIRFRIPNIIDNMEKYPIAFPLTNHTYQLYKGDEVYILSNNKNINNQFYYIPTSHYEYVGIRYKNSFVDITKDNILDEQSPQGYVFLQEHEFRVRDNSKKIINEDTHYINTQIINYPIVDIKDSDPVSMSVDQDNLNDTLERVPEHVPVKELGLRIINLHGSEEHNLIGECNSEITGLQTFNYYEHNLDDGMSISNSGRVVSFFENTSDSIHYSQKTLGTLTRVGMGDASLTFSMDQSSNTLLDTLSSKNHVFDMNIENFEFSSIFINSIINLSLTNGLTDINLHGNSFSINAMPPALTSKNLLMGDNSQESSDQQEQSDRDKTAKEKAIEQAEKVIEELKKLYRGLIKDIKSLPKSTVMVDEESAALKSAFNEVSISNAASKLASAFMYIKTGSEEQEQSEEFDDALDPLKAAIKSALKSYVSQIIEAEESQIRPLIAELKFTLMSLINSTMGQILSRIQAIVSAITATIPDGYIKYSVGGSFVEIGVDKSFIRNLDRLLSKVNSLIYSLVDRIIAIILGRLKEAVKNIINEAIDTIVDELVDALKQYFEEYLSKLPASSSDSYIELKINDSFVHLGTDGIEFGFGGTKITINSDGIDIPGYQPI